MGEALRALFQSVWNFLGRKAPSPPTVGGYPVDYSALTDEQIATPGACDELFKTGEWISVSRKSW